MGTLADKYRAKPSLAAKYRVGPDVDPLPAPEADPLDALKPDRTLGAIGAGVQQGVSLGFSDELTGAVAAVAEGIGRNLERIGLKDAPKPAVEADPALNPNTPTITKSWGAAQPAGNAPVVPEVVPVPERESLSDVYRRVRDRDRGANKTAEASHPALYAAGELAGGLAVPVPGGGLAKGAGLGAKVAKGAKVGAGFGLAIGAGKSEAEDLGGVGKDALVNGLISAPVGAAAGAGSHVLGKLANRFGGKAAATETALRADKVGGARDSALGSVRQAKAEAIRMIERYTADANNPRLAPATRQAAIRFLDSTDGRLLAEEAAQALRDQTPDQLGKLATAKQAFADAPALAMKEIDEYLAKSSLRHDVAPRVVHYAKPAIAAMAGGAAGGPLGAAAGGLLGVAAGKPGRAFANLVQKSPRFTIQLNRLLEGGSDQLAAALGKAGPLLAAQSDLEAKRRLVAQAMDEDPAVAAAVEHLAEQPQTLRQRFAR